MNTSTIKPGLLVSLHTYVRGGVNYQRVDIDPEHETADGSRVARWETTREVADPAEHARAVNARLQARTAISNACHATAFGLLCPTDREEQLERGIATARAIADEHNMTARLTRLEVNVLIGRIASDDVAAAKAIGAEVRGLLDDMEAGIRRADPKAIRDAADEAKRIGGMLTDGASAQVSAAIAEARANAREIVKRVGKAGEDAAEVVRDLRTVAINGARFAFLDLDEGTVTSQVPVAPILDLAGVA